MCLTKKRSNTSKVTCKIVREVVKLVGNTKSNCPLISGGSAMTYSKGSSVARGKVVHLAAPTLTAIFLVDVDH